jgi:hypothetical protein
VSGPVARFAVTISSRWSTSLRPRVASSGRAQAVPAVPGARRQHLRVLDPIPRAKAAGTRGRVAERGTCWPEDDVVLYGPAARHDVAGQTTGGFNLLGAGGKAALEPVHALSIPA